MRSLANACYIPELLRGVSCGGAIQIDYRYVLRLIQAAAVDTKKSWHVLAFRDDTTRRSHSYACTRLATAAFGN